MSLSKIKLNSHNEKKIQVLLIISILIIAFSISFLIRILPVDYGWELQEFDPFFNYRATEYIIDNGFSKYQNWHDELSWYPTGRNVSSTSQEILHYFTAITYYIFGFNSDLYDYVILFPVIIGSLTCIPVFLLGRIIGGTSTGLFSSLLFSISIPILVRGQVGWFKSEPLGIFLSTLSVYLFLSGLYSENKKITTLKMIFSGIIFTSALSAWGGNHYFILIIGLFIFCISFIKKPKSSIWSIPLFIGCIYISTLFYERLTVNFIFGISGLTLSIPTAFFIFSRLVEQKFNQEISKKIILVSFIIFSIIATIIVCIKFFNLFEYNQDIFFNTGSYRYLNALFPFLTTNNPLIESISEHALARLDSSFLLHSVTMIFGSIGLWYILFNKKLKTQIKNPFRIFTLILGFFGLYISSAFMRLEIFAALSLIILSSLGISTLSKTIFISNKKPLFIFIFFALIIILLITPLIFPVNSSIFDISHTPPTILNGGTSFPISTNDWNHALDWIKNNTNDNSIFISWWDYGYWIETKAERTTYVDNATLDTHSIENIAKIFFSEPVTAWNSLKNMDADYIVIFIAAQKTQITDSDGNYLYQLHGGGDESKLYWISKIAKNNPIDFFNSNITPNYNFWENTLMGKLIPYSLFGYINPNNPTIGSIDYAEGYVPLFNKQIKYESQSNQNLFNLVYSSPSFDYAVDDQFVTGIFIYEVNKKFMN